MSTHTAADLAKSLQTPRPESPFKVGEDQIKETRELAKIFYAETKIPNMDALTTHPNSLMNKRTKLPMAEDQTAPPPRVDT